MGRAAAHDLVTWLAASDLYAPQDVLRGRVTVDWQARPDRLFALTQALTALSHNGGDARTHKAVLDVCLDAGNPGRKDIVVPTIRTLAPRLPRGVKRE